MSVLPAVSHLLALLGAIPLAALGGAAFLRGVLGVAAGLRVPQVLVATTLAAFATSAPEMAVSSLAALAGQPEIGLGDALGSNVANVGLILGGALLFGPMTADARSLRRDFALALLVPVLTLLLAADGELSRADGLWLLALFAAWAVLVAREAGEHRRNGSRAAAMGDTTGAPAGDAPASHPGVALLYLVVGMAALSGSGRLFVTGASSVAVASGLSPYVVGLRVVAVGTSLPEMTTVLLARMKGHDDIGLGTLLGSNLFNGLAIAGTAATLHPIRPPLGELGATLGFGVLTVLLMLPRAGLLSRRRGLALLAAYAAFVALQVHVLQAASRQQAFLSDSGPQAACAALSPSPRA